MTGSLSGQFAALASKSAATGGRDIQFKFTWTGQQTPEGADAKTQDGITYTVKYKPTPAGPNNPPTPTEPPNTPSTPNTPNTTNSGPRKIAKTGFNGGLVGGLGLLFLVTGVLAVRQKRS